MDIWLLIFILLVLTYVSRLAGIELMENIKIESTLRQYFTYVPIAIMTALIVKQIFLTTPSGQINISLPVILASITTAIAIEYIKQFLPSIILGMLVGILFRLFFS